MEEEIEADGSERFVAEFGKRDDMGDEGQGRLLGSCPGPQESGGAGGEINSLDMF